MATIRSKHRKSSGDANSAGMTILGDVCASRGVSEHTCLHAADRSPAPFAALAPHGRRDRGAHATTLDALGRDGSVPALMVSGSQTVWAGTQIVSGSRVL